MADPPLFSVVMPLFNKREYVRRTLETVLGQRDASFEVVIVDDASTDGSVDTIADLAGDRVRIVRQANAGPGAARNRGCAEARGRWFAFIDADDLWTDGHLAALARIIAARPEARAVATASRQLPADQAGRASEERGETAIRSLDYFADDGEAFVHTSSVAVERDAFARSGGFGPYCPGEDEELWARLALAERFAVSDAVTSTYLRANAGIMDQVAAAEAPPVTVATSPVGATLRAALRDPALASRHPAIRDYLQRLRLRDVRICLYAGYPRLARAGLLALDRPTGAKQAFYWALALLPSPAGRRLTRLSPLVRAVANRICVGGGCSG